MLVVILPETMNDLNLDQISHVTIKVLPGDFVSMIPLNYIPETD